MAFIELNKINGQGTVFVNVASVDMVKESLDTKNSAKEFATRLWVGGTDFYVEETLEQVFAKINEAGK